MRLHVTSTAYNAGQFASACVQSILAQSYGDWDFMYLDGDSSDDTMLHVYRAIDVAHEAQVTLASAPGQSLEKLVPLWRSFPDEDVIVWLDGDDSLATPFALRIVADAHAGGAIVTYGSFLMSDGSAGWNGLAPPNTRERPFPWTLSHLRTFRAGAFKQIPDGDLRDEDGQYYRYSTDRAVMLPLWEMFRNRAVYIADNLVVYTNRHAAIATETQQTEATRVTGRIHFGRGPYTKSDWAPG